MADLHIVSSSRTEGFTDSETVKLGRLLIESSGSAHVWYPDGTETAVAVVRAFSRELTEPARRRLAEILAEFDEVLVG